MEDRTHRRLTDKDIARIADTYNAWRGEEDAIERAGEYEDVPGFCKSATLEEIRARGHVLTPGRYVGAEPFDEKMRQLTAQLTKHQTEARRLDAAIEANMKTLGFTINE